MESMKDRIKRASEAYKATTQLSPAAKKAGKAIKAISKLASTVKKPGA